MIFKVSHSNIEKKELEVWRQFLEQWKENPIKAFDLECLKKQCIVEIIPLPTIIIDEVTSEFKSSKSIDIILGHRVRAQTLDHTLVLIHTNWPIEYSS